MFYKHCLCLMKRSGSERDASKYIKVLFIHADHIEFTMWWLKNQSSSTIIYFALTYTFSRIFTSKVDSNLLYMTPHFLLQSETPSKTHQAQTVPLLPTSAYDLGMCVCSQNFVKPIKNLQYMILVQTIVYFHLSMTFRSVQ